MATTTTATLVINKTTDITAISNADFGKIVPADLTKFSSDQLGVISADQIAQISDKGLAAIAKQNYLPSDIFHAIPVKSLAGLNIKLITGDQFSDFSQTQVAALTPAQVALITNSTYTAMSEDSLGYFSLTGNFSAVDMKKLDTSGYTNFAKLTPEQVGALSPLQLKALSQSQIQHISQDQAAALKPAQVAALGANFVSYLSVDTVNNMTTAAFAALPANVVNALAANLGTLSEDNIGALTSAQVAGLTSGRLTSLLGNTNFSSASNAALAGITKTNVSGLDLSKLTDTQFASLSTAQLDLLKTTTGSSYDVADISDAQAAALTPAQASGLSTAFVGALTVSEFGALTGAALAAIPVKSFANLPSNASGLGEDNLGSITSAQIAALDSTHLSRLVALDVPYLSVKALAGLNKNIQGFHLEGLTGDGQFESLTATQLNLLANTSGVTDVSDITNSQMELLTPNQAKGLSKAFITALSNTQVAHLTPEAIAAIPVASFAGFNANNALIGNGTTTGLTADNGTGVTSAQLAVLTAAKVAALSFSTTSGFEYLSTAAMAGLVKANITASTGVAGSAYLDTAHMTAEQIAVLKPAQIGFFNPDQITAVTANPEALTSTMIATMSSAQVNAIASPTIISQLQPSAFAGFNAKNVQGLADGSGKAMPTLTAEQTAYFSADAMKGVVATQVNGSTVLSTLNGAYGLTSDAFAAILPTSLKAMTPVTLAAVSTLGFQGITPDQVKALTADQIKALTELQISKLDAEDAANLSATQVVKWSEAQAQSLTTAAIAAISLEAIGKLNIGGFDASQVKALSNGQFLKLSTSQVASIDSGVEANLTSDQVQGVSTLGSLVNIPGLNRDVLGSMTAIQMSKLEGAGVLEHLTADQALLFSDEAYKWLYSTKGYSTISKLGDTTDSGISKLTVFAAPTAGGETITAGKLAVNITGSAGSETIIGGAGNDSISGGATANPDSISSGAGNDNITVTNAAVDSNLTSWSIDGGTGTDTLTLGVATTSLADSAFLHVSDVEILALTGASTVTLGANAEGAGITKVIPAAANTTVNSSVPVAVDASSLGANVLTLKGVGAITATGGSAAETYKIDTTASKVGNGLVTITNYVNATDLIDFGSSARLAAIDATATVAGTNVDVNDVGYITFDAADNTYDKKVTAIEADAGLSAANKLAVFISGSDTYVYFSGAATTGDIQADDQIIKLANVAGAGLKLDSSYKIIAANALGAPQSLDLATVDDTGTSSSDNLTKNTTALTISGTSNAGATVTIYDTDGTTSLGSTTANSTTGVFSLDVALTNAPSTPHSLTAKATKTGYTESIASSPLAITVDATAPTLTISTFTFSADTGTSATDFKTKTAAQTIGGTLSGQLASGDILYGSLDDGATWIDITNKVSTTTITWTGATLLGSSNIKMKVTDAAGNDGAVASQAYVLDTTPPTLAVSSVDINADTGSSATDFITKTASQTITGTLSSGLATGDVLKGSVDNGSTWTDITSKVSGTAISWNGATLSGTSNILFKITDLAGNDSSTTGSQAYTLDTAGPTLSSSSPADNDTLVSKSANVVLTFNEPVIKGTGNIVINDTVGSGATQTIDVTDNNQVTIASTVVTVNPTSDFLATGVAYDVQLAAGVITDVAGNNYAGISSASTLNFTVADTTAPTANFTSATDNLGTVTGALTSGDTTDDTALALAGTNESGSTVSVYNGSQLLGPATISGTGWTYSAIIADGITYQFNVKETDAAGNVSAATSNFTVIGDTAAPTITFDATLVGDNKVNSTEDNTSVTISGTAVGADLQPITVSDGTVSHTVNVASGGAWSVSFISNEVQAWTEGVDSVSITADVSDAAGNAATQVTKMLSYDATAPTANFTSATDNLGTVTGALTSGDTTDDTALALAGTNESGSTVSVYNGSQLLGPATISGTGWTYSAIIADGNTYQFNVKETDAAGNVSAATSNFTVIGDTAVPAEATPTPVTYTDGQGGGTLDTTHFAATDTITLNFSEQLASISAFSINNSHSIGTAGNGAVSIVLDNPADTTATFTLGTDSDLASGDTITLTGVDLAGNSASLSFLMAQ